jgi:hypothetical protein
MRAYYGSVLVRPYVESRTSLGAEYLGVQSQILHPSYDSCSRAYGYPLLQLNIRVTKINLTLTWVHSVDMNAVNKEILTVIGFGANSEIGFGSTGPYPWDYSKLLPRRLRWFHSGEHELGGTGSICVLSINHPASCGGQLETRTLKN